MPVFDRSSGQVYTETTSTQIQSMIPTWTTQTRGRRDDPKKFAYRSEGCTTLQQMALRACVWHVDDMEPESLQWLGWHYAGLIYRQLKEIDSLTYNAWSVFQKAFPAEIDHDHHFHISERDAWSLVPAALPSIVTRLANLDSNMLTFLCIRNFSLHMDHLMTLTKVGTLTALVLEQNPTVGIVNRQQITGKNLKDWVRAAHESQSLTKLKLLVIGGVGVPRNTVIQSVTGFPALSLLGVNDTREPGGPFSGEWYTPTSQWLSENVAVSDDQQRPNSIWKNSNVTKARKVQQLYQIASGFAQASDTSTDSSRTLTLSYVCNERSLQADSLAWFFRRPTDMITQSMVKRAVGEEEKGNTVDKRRKVRATKKVDVGSLLGAFI